MKYLSFPALLIAAVLTFSCKKQVTDQPPSNTLDTSVNLASGLLLYLPFDGDMADHSGNNNSTTAVGGGGLVYDEHGYYQSAFGGTGNGERLVVTNNGSIQFDSTLSLSMEIMTRTNARQSFISMVNQSTSQGFSFGLAIATIGDPRFNFAVSDSSLGCSDYITTSNTTNLYSDTLLQPYRFYNIVCTYNKGVQQLYINGHLTDSLTSVSKRIPICPAAQIIIGGWWDGDPASVNGVLDNVRLYNRVLNSNEIAELSKDFQE